MDKKIKLTVIMVLYCLTGVLLSYMFSLEVKPDHSFGNKKRLLYAVIFILLLTAVTFLARKFFSGKELRHAVMKTYTCGLALYYLFAIMGVFFFSKDLAHYGTELSKAEYWEHYVKLIPFQTYHDIIVGAENFSDLAHDFLVMLGGRFLVFLPMGLFMLILVRWCRPIVRYHVLMSVAIIGIDLVQYSLHLGNVTLDGMILNFLGASAAYFIFKNEKIQKLLVKLEFVYN